MIILKGINTFLLTIGFWCALILLYQIFEYFMDIATWVTDANINKWCKFIIYAIGFVFIVYMTYKGCAYFGKL